MTQYNLKNEGDVKNPVTLLGYVAKVEDNEVKHNGFDNFSFQGSNDDVKSPTRETGQIGGGQYASFGDLESGWCPDLRRRCFNRKVLYKRIPALAFWRGYDSDKMISDLVAGVTVGLTMIPQAIAYANVAGLPPKYGLYSSFMACFVYAVLGSCKDSSIGPTAITAILIRENIHGMGPEFAVLLCFLTGLVQLLMGIFQLGFFIDFISGPVSVGFTSAAAIVIAMTQVKDLLGLNLKGSKVVEIWSEFTFAEVKKWDAILGFSCIAILFALRKVKDIKIGPEDTKEKTAVQRCLASILWFISTSRNIIVVMVSSSVAYYFRNHLRTEAPFKLSQAVEPGLPDFRVPNFQATVGNKTYDFFEMTSKLGSGIFILPLLSLLENVSLAKVFSDGKSIDATQELLALGTCNLVSSFAGSIPLSGALSRGAVNNASGAKTTFGSVYAGMIVIISLKFFTSYFVYIPKAALAAVIIAAVVFMVEFHVLQPIWRSKKVDLIPAAATFLSCLLLRLELGIGVGITINVLFLLYASARPTVQVEKLKSEWGYEYILITPDRSLSFPSTEYVRNVISKVGLKQGFSSVPVVVDSRHIQGADFTAARGIKLLIEDFVKRKQPLLFFNLKASVVETIRGVEPVEFYHCQTEKQLHELLKAYYFKCEKLSQP